MDPDQHRPKRSRLSSTDGINDIRRDSKASGEQSKQPPTTSHSVLPLHGSRTPQSFFSKTVGPSLQQIERDAQNPPPEQKSTTHDAQLFSRFPSTVPVPRRNDEPFSLSRQPPMASGREMTNSRPILVPASQGDSSKSSAHHHKPLNSTSAGQALLDAQRQIANPSHNSHFSLERPFQANLLAAHSFPYPSIILPISVDSITTTSVFLQGRHQIITHHLIVSPMLL